MGAAVVLMPTRCIRITIGVHGCACSSFTFGLVAIGAFGFGRCIRCAGYSEKSRKRKRHTDLRNHGHSSLIVGQDCPVAVYTYSRIYTYTSASLRGPPISGDKVLISTNMYRCSCEDEHWFIVISRDKVLISTNMYRRSCDDEGRLMNLKAHSLLNSPRGPALATAERRHRTADDRARPTARQRGRRARAR